MVLRGREGAYWGSLHLDTFGEEDGSLRRGQVCF